MRPINQIAAEIHVKWGGKAAALARPYLVAMYRLSSINDSFGLDSGKDVVLRFLGNAQGFRGPDAKRLKEELKEHLK